jgi:hypothetical protein
MATVTVRALGIDGDPLQGNGQSNFISDLAAVTQIIKTRLLLFQGEWFLNLLDGLPMFTGILGSSGSSRNVQVIINLISQRINQTSPWVTGISSLFATYNPASRQFAYEAVVETVFGTVTVGNTPGSQATLPATS